MQRVYTIPLKKVKRKSRSGRSSYAVRFVREFLERHLKAEEVKLGKNLNEFIWKNGLKKPPRRIRVIAETEEKDGKTIVKAELEGYKYKAFKPKKKEEKGVAEKLKEKVAGLRGSAKAEQIKELEEKIEGKKKPEVSKKPEEKTKEKVSPKK